MFEAEHRLRRAECDLETFTLKSMLTVGWNLLDCIHGSDEAN